MRILAFDQATKISAWALFDGDQLVDHGLIDLHKDEGTAHRIDQMSDELSDVIQKSAPDLLAIEDVSYQRNAQSLIELARLQGRILQMAHEADIPVKIYKPSAWRKVVGIKTGKGIKRPALKRAAVALVKEQYHISVSDDAAEAICIGQCAQKEL